MTDCKNKIFDEKVCPVCGKSFFKPVDSIYKYREGSNRKYTCSYTCWVKKLKELGRW